MHTTISRLSSSPGRKLAAYGALLLAVFAGGAAVGAAVGPIEVGPAATSDPHVTAAGDHDGG